jgi:hypothetical protein
VTIHRAHRVRAISGLSLWADGGPAVTVAGNVYAAAGTLRNNGNGPLTINGSLVVGGVDLRGVPATVNVTQSNVFADLAATIVHLTW